MQVILHGVRGSTAAPGRDFLEVGGNTSCVAITPNGHDAPTVLLDAGTGLSSVSVALDGAAYHGAIVLTHLHGDHVQGLPFFRAGDRDDGAYGAGRCCRHSAELHPGWRVLPPGSWPGRYHRRISDRTGRAARRLDIRGHRGRSVHRGGLPGHGRGGAHKGGRTYGDRIEADGTSFAYLPDHHPAVDPHPGVELARESTCSVHGAMFADSERAIAHSYGHATLGETRRLAREAGVGRLIMVHHSPSRTDDEVDALAREFRRRRSTGHDRAGRR